MFLMQYFCLHDTIPFFKSYPEIESTWPTAECRGRKPFDTWYYIVTCAALYVSFPSKSKAINIFPKHIMKSKARDQSIQVTNKLFCLVIVNKYLCNVLWKFLVKIESTWRREIKEQAPQLTLLYRGRTAKSSHLWCCIRKLFLKFCSIHMKHLCWSLFLKKTFKLATLLKRDTTKGFSCKYCKFFNTTHLFWKISVSGCFLIFSMVHSYPKV